MPSIDGNISDIFFNLDLSHAVRNDKRGHFECFDDKVLKEEADWLIASLQRLGITSCEVPTAEDLIADFHARV